MPFAPLSHGRWQVKYWLARAERAGLLLIEPEEGWRAALVAADVVIGDHGSVTTYGAAAGAAILLAAVPKDRMVEGTATATLAIQAPHLQWDLPLKPQV